jgi:hypothetical protein
MKNIIIIIMMSISFIGYSQTNCKFTKNEIDDMTGEKVVISKSFIMCVEFMGLGLHLTPKQINDKYILNFSFTYPRSFSMSESDKIILKLENDELITLSTNKNFNSEGEEIFTGSGYTTLYGGNIDIEITKEQLEKLSVNKLSKLRIYFSEGFDSVHNKVSKKWIEGFWEKDNFSSNKLKKFMKELSCLLSI